MNAPVSMGNWRRELARLEGAYAPATIRAYRCDLQVFEEWCRSEGHIPFPVTPEVLCQFIENQGQAVIPATIRRRLVSLRKAHNLLGFPDPSAHEDVRLTYRRVMRSQPSRPRQAAGLTEALRDALIAAQPDTPWGLRNAGMISLGYELLTRRSELVALRDADLSERDDGSLRVLVRRGKSDQFGAGRVACTSPDTAARIRVWTAWRGDRTAWLFCPIQAGKPLDRSLSTFSVARIIKNAAREAIGAKAGAEFSAHSMRVGAAQDLLLRGFDTVAIMRAGGWKSVAVLARYLENADHNVWH